MLEHISYHLEWAKQLNEEIENDSSNWFKPKGPVTGGDLEGDFDYGQIKFVNRNLNYFYFENMISHAMRNTYQFNPNFTKTLEFCDTVRSVVNENGPFGRMCIWKLESNCYLKPHVDNWPYHGNITRYIFCVGDVDYEKIIIKINDKEIKAEQGLLFNFYPNKEIHHFANYSNDNFYFLGFDYWNLIKLAEVSSSKKIDASTEIEYKSGFGGYNKKTQYMSPE